MNGNCLDGRDAATARAENDLRAAPRYPGAEAGRLVGLHPARVRRWLNGYKYVRRGEVRRRPPVVRPAARDRYPTYASFLELVDLLFAKRLVDDGVSVGRLREMGAEGPLAREPRKAEPLFADLSEQLDFDSRDGLARRWFPRGRGGHVVLDPFRGFGRPTLARLAIRTSNIFDFYCAENESVDAVRKWWDITEAEVIAVVEFERGLSRALADGNASQLPAG